jgi:Winged helix-turn-helix DNA-binding
MADFLTEQRAAIDNRLKELRPLYDEYLTLEKAKEALEGVSGPRRRGPGRPPGSRSTTKRRASSGNGRRRRRGRRGANRADQVLKVIRENPGISVSEIGDKLGMKQKNYLYRVVGNLQSEGAVKKQGRGFTAA